MTAMHNPPHPGEVLKGLWLDPAGITITAAAESLGVSRKHVSSIVNGHAAITADFALRLAAWLNTSAAAWMGMQAAHDLWLAAQQRRPKIKAMQLPLAA